MIRDAPRTRCSSLSGVSVGLTSLNPVTEICCFSWRGSVTSSLSPFGQTETGGMTKTDR